MTSAKVKDGSLAFSDFTADAVSPRLFAHVSSTGTLGDQSGVVSAGRTGTGTYAVRFNRSLRGCVPVASVGFGFGPGVVGAGALAQASMDGTLEGNVKVTIYRGFTFVDVSDNDFNLVVVC